MTKALESLKVLDETISPLLEPILAEYEDDLNDKITANYFIIEQALLKAQEQEQVLNLIKEKPLKSACTINYIKANKNNIKMLSYSLYCLTLGVDFRVLKEEFDLLKRWLENEL